MRIKQFATGYKALDDAGQFEALVAVFGNVDRVGDRIVKGAFADSLKGWEQKGRPIPVIFSHQWDSLDAHIGHVTEAKETDQGLYVRAQLDLDDPSAAKVWRLLKSGRLAEFSFAYDVKDEKRQNGANELLALDLLEIGPTLVGANPATELLGVKSAGAVERKAAIAGSYEERRDRIAEAARGRYEDRETWVIPYATFDDHAVIALMREDGAEYLSVDYTEDDDGAISLGADQPVQLSLVVTAKSRVMATITPQEPAPSAPATGKESPLSRAGVMAAIVELELATL